MSEISENKATRGSIAKIILTALQNGDKYGYEICKEIERLSNGTLILKQPSLYSSLRRMEEQNLISSYWQDSDIGGKRHYYSLTQQGKELIQNTSKEAENRMEDLMQNLPLNDFEYVENSEDSLPSENSGRVSVVSQGNLFNLAPKTDIKYIDETSSESENNSFVQYDLFNQNIKFVKDSSKNTDKVEVYKNKYEEMDNHGQDIEPIKDNSQDEASDYFEKLDRFNEVKDENNVAEQGDKNVETNNEPITRASVFGDNSEDKGDENFSLSFSFDSPKDETISSPSSTDNENISDNNNVENQEYDEGLVAEESTLSHNSIIKSDDLTASDIKDENIIQNENMENTYERKDNSIVWDDTVVLPKDTVDESKSNDYKIIIGQLYNSSKLTDPYEENKFFTFKEIFPSAKVEEKKETSKDRSELDELIANNSHISSQQNIKVMQEQFSLQGLRLKMHDNSQNKSNKNSYVDVNRLRMHTSWIVSFVMLIEVIFCYIFLKNSNNIVSGQLLVYFLGASLAVCLSLVVSLENMFDRFKLIEIKPNIKQIVTKMIIIFLFLCIITFATCLLCGMQSLAQKEFLSYWLIPVLMSSNLILYSLIHHLLYKTGKYNN